MRGVRILCLKLVSIDALEKVQKAARKMSLSYHERLAELDLTTLETRRLRYELMI